MKPCPSINTIGISTQLLSTPTQQVNLQEIIYQLEQLGPTQTTECHTNTDLEYSNTPTPMVTTKH